MNASAMICADIHPDGVHIRCPKVVDVHVQASPHNRMVPAAAARRLFDLIDPWWGFDLERYMEFLEQLPPEERALKENAIWKNLVGQRRADTNDHLRAAWSRFTGGQQPTSLYTLNAAREPVQCRSTQEWAMWFEHADRQVARTNTAHATVITSFLGVDHSVGWTIPWSTTDESLAPILFETMVFGGPHDQAQARYTSWAAAQTGHDVMVEMLKDEENDTAPK